MSALVIPQGYSYVGGALLSTVFLLLGQNAVVSRFRAKSGIKYPQAYAEKAQVEADRNALLFNCAQRAHQNTLENLPIVVILTAISGLSYPILAASACGYWVLSRASYTRGYVTGDPKKRGTFLYRSSYIGLVAMLGISVYTVGQAVLAGL